MKCTNQHCDINIMALPPLRRYTYQNKEYCDKCINRIRIIPSSNDYLFVKGDAN